MPSITPLPSLALTSPIGPVDSFTDGTSLATGPSGPVLPLLRIPNIHTNQGELNLEFWGTKDGAGNITAIAEANITGMLGSASSVHIFFDTLSRPVLFRDDASGYSLNISYDSATQQTFTVCDPQRAAVATVPLTISGGVPQVGAVSDGGTCTPLNTILAAHRFTTSIPTNVQNLPSLEKIITGGSYIAGIGFAVSAILGFKQHKDNPTVVPISTPIALIFVAAALLFLPAVFSATGGTLFGLEGSFASIDGVVPFFEPLSP